MDGACQKLCEKLKIDFNLFSLLDEKDDWVFILKSAFLTECAIKQTIAWKIGGIDGDKHLGAVSKLGLAQLVALSASLDVFEEDERRFIIKLAEIRNNLVHNLYGHTFTFDTFFKDSNTTKAFTKWTSPFVSAVIEIISHKIPRDKFIAENPRFAIVVGVMAIFAIGWLVFDIENSKSRMAEMQKEIVEKYCKFLNFVELLKKERAQKESSAQSDEPNEL